jgi:hypothetical protein
VRGMHKRMRVPIYTGVCVCTSKYAFASGKACASHVHMQGRRAKTVSMHVSVEQRKRLNRTGLSRGGGSGGGVSEDDVSKGKPKGIVCKKVGEQALCVRKWESSGFMLQTIDEEDHGGASRGGMNSGKFSRGWSGKDEPIKSAKQRCKGGCIFWQDAT